MEKRAVLLTEYDPRWLDLFEQERENTYFACGSAICDVHHIGSTAIPGMLVKPIIDILVTLRRYEDGLGCIGPLRDLGYQFRGANGIEGRLFFTKGDPRSHHLHMYAEGHPAVRRHINFRDFLRSRPEEALAYRELKRDLSRRFAADSASYSEAKDEFCSRIDRLALREGESKS